MKKCQLVDNTLDIASKHLAERAQKAVETGQLDRTASSSIHFLVTELAELFLTKKQQEQVKALLDLYDRCLFPLAYAFPVQRQLCPLCPEGEQNEVSNGFVSEPCQIDGVACCEICYRERLIAKRRGAG